MNNNRSYIILIAVIAIFSIGFLVSIKKIGKLNTQQINSFESCVSAGFPIQESFPRKCTDASGNSFTEDVNKVTDAVVNEKVRVYYPTPGATVRTPIVFSGEAKGPWYFEGSFPVEVRDKDGKVLARAIARARGEWMTEKFVPFDDAIAIPLKVTSGNLFLIIKKDNPSGDPSKDEEVVIPIKYIKS